MKTRYYLWILILLLLGKLGTFAWIQTFENDQKVKNRFFLAETKRLLDYNKHTSHFLKYSSYKDYLDTNRIIKIERLNDIEDLGEIKSETAKLNPEIQLHKTFHFLPEIVQIELLKKRFFDAELAYRKVLQKKYYAENYKRRIILDEITFWDKTPELLVYLIMYPINNRFEYSWEFNNNKKIHLGNPVKVPDKSYTWKAYRTDLITKEKNTYSGEQYK